MNNLKSKYQKLAEELKTVQKQRTTTLEELAEAKGNKTAYERSRDELIEQAKTLNADPKNLKAEIEKLIEQLTIDIEADKKLCDNLDNTKIG